MGVYITQIVVVSAQIKMKQKIYARRE
jgi:hypothetical protein